VNHASPDVGRFAEERIPDDIEICITRESEAGAESGASGLFNVYEKFGGLIQAEAGVEGQ
jgi:hypothetical protein